MVVLRQRSTNYWFFFINEYVDRTPLAEFFLLLYLLCRSWVATRAMDDDALSFPFFDNSRMALACGGPGVVQIILSYCEATVAAFLRLHHFEIQERKGPSASFELLYPKKQESGQDQDPEAWRTNFENRIYRQLSAYLDFMFAFEQETIKKATEQPPPHCYLEMYNLQQNVDSLFMKRIVELRNLQQQRISEIYTERLRSNLSRWVAGENVYHLPKNSNATKFHPVNNAMSLWGPTAGTAVNMVAPCGPQGLGLVTKDQIDKLIKATTIRYSRSSSGLGISLLYYEVLFFTQFSLRLLILTSNLSALFLLHTKKL
jgi:hypothetical protein